MSTFTTNDYRTLTDFTGGVTGVAGRGQTWGILIDGVWDAGDEYIFQIVLPARTFDFGVGRVTLAVPVACIALNERVHFVAGTDWYGSENNDATEWEQQAAGAFKVDTSQQMAVPGDLTGLAAYQGLIAIASRYNIQLWVLDANPDNLAIKQVMNNVGTFAGLTMQSIGELDVLFGSDSGVRSLRSRETTLNAYVEDMGSPINSLIREAIAGVSAAVLGNAVSIVEPRNNRYFFWLPGSTTIYVLSYFPVAKIFGWSTYLATAFFGQAQQALTPVKFAVFNGQTYLRVVNQVDGYTYMMLLGGLNGTTYDATVATIITPFVDINKPGTKKIAQAFDSDIEGRWRFFVTSNWMAQPPQYTSVTDSAVQRSTFDQGYISYSDEGTHFSMQAVSDPTVGYAAVESLILYFEWSNSPAE